MRLITSAALLGVALAACSPAPAPAPAPTPAPAPAPEAPAPTPEAAAPAPEAPAPEAPAPTDVPMELDITGADGAKLVGNVTNGQKVFRLCQACHVLEPGMNRVGPTLYQIIGRTAGQVEGFRYTPANANSGIEWTQAEMFTYLENPRAHIPGTSMSFAGLKKEQDRADVIAYIISQSN